MAEGLDERFRRLGVGSSDAADYVSSAEDFEFLCNACKTTGDHVEATGYCVDCAGYLCTSCIRPHFKIKSLKGHVLFHLNSRMTKLSDITSGHNKQSQQQTKEENSSDSIDNLAFLKSVNVKTGSDETNCNIVAIAVLSGQLLAVADYNNKCVKIINSYDDVVRHSVKLTNHPFSMKRLPNDQLGVTLPNINIINIISTRRGFNVTKTLRVDGLCLDIVYFNGKLLVSFEKPVLFQVLDMTGKVLEQIVPGQDVTLSCTVPNYIALSPDEKTIYISDWKSKICLSVDMKGKKLAQCKELTYPKGIVCSPNLPYIIICDKDKHVVRKLTMDLQCGEILLNKSDGLEYPSALCLCPEQRYVIVSSMSVQAEHCNKIRIYQY